MHKPNSLRLSGRVCVHHYALFKHEGHGARLLLAGRQGRSTSIVVQSGDALSFRYGSAAIHSTAAGQLHTLAISVSHPSTGKLAVGQLAPVRR